MHRWNWVHGQNTTFEELTNCTRLTCPASQACTILQQHLVVERLPFQKPVIRVCSPSVSTVKLEDCENKGIQVLRRSWIDVLLDNVNNWEAVPDKDHIATATDDRLLGP